MQKLNNNAITIQDFSTGVILTSTETGSGVVSLSQNLMNVSCRDGQIPYSIERAIINNKIFFS